MIKVLRYKHRNKYRNVKDEDQIFLSIYTELLPRFYTLISAFLVLAKDYCFYPFVKVILIDTFHEIPQVMFKQLNGICFDKPRISLERVSLFQY